MTVGYTADVRRVQAAPLAPTASAHGAGSLEMGRKRKFHPPPSFHLLLPQLPSPFKMFEDVAEPPVFPIFGA